MFFLEVGRRFPFHGSAFEDVLEPWKTYWKEQFVFEEVLFVFDGEPTSSRSGQAPVKQSKAYLRRQTGFGAQGICPEAGLRSGNTLALRMDREPSGQSGCCNIISFSW